MKYHEMRFAIPKDTYKKYKILCTKLDLSIPKQTAQIIDNFIMLQENNMKLLKEAVERQQEDNMKRIGGK